MEYDGTDNDLDKLLRESPELRDFLKELAEQGSDRWALRSKWRTGFNATHVEADVMPGEDGVQEGIVYASGHYARFREHGTRWNRAEHVMHDFIQDVSD
ncbi:hypothetical protein [Nocardia otitidiscaviarum]|uniref:hypothetical protein n=1 Tax=Nocardia otitidiscaviarum TaxID=1823 RepID=UPI0004A6DB0E|nr:hypothetical protein [Nocardia otitidiscaviarum]